MEETKKNIQHSELEIVQKKQCEWKLRLDESEMLVKDLTSALEKKDVECHKLKHKLKNKNQELENAVIELSKSEYSIKTL